MPIILLQLLLLACVTALWAVSLQRVDLSRMNDLGLISVLSPVTYFALAILTVGFCLAVHRRSTPTFVLLLHVVVLIVVIHATPVILYGTLRYAWAWKHVGIVDYIQRHGSVDPSVSFLNAYHNWPGFFALGALLTEAAGFKSALSFASWGPPFFNLLDLGALLLIFNTFAQDRRLVWLSVWFFYLMNWVGQDYFSPQAMSYFLSLVVLGICLQWFPVIAPTLLSTHKRWPVLGYAASVFRRLVFDRRTYTYTRLVGSLERAREQHAKSPPLQRAGLLTIIVLIFAVIVSSHQLTPFMTLFALMGLVLVQRCRLRNLPILLCVMAATWIVTMAVSFLNGNIYWIVQSIGHMDANANSTLIDVQKVTRGMETVAFVGRALTASVYCLAFLGFIRRFRQGYWDLACAVLALAPIPMLVANSYGGEMLFRVYLFSLPFMAFFGAALFYPDDKAGSTRRTQVLAVVVSGALLVGLCFAYYGKERMNYFSKNEVAASQYLYNVAPAGALLLDVDGDYPWAFKNYEHYNYRSLVFNSESGILIPQKQRKNLLSDPADFVAAVMKSTNPNGAYLIMSRAQAATSNENGYLPVGSLDVVERSLKRSKLFKVIFENPDATVFELTVLR
jgi:hypothetical protein